MTLDELFVRYKNPLNQQQRKVVAEAFEFAKKAHEGQKLECAPKQLRQRFFTMFRKTRA